MPVVSVVTIGGSAGSLPPLLELVATLPGDLPAAVLVAQHTGQQAPSQLPDILTRHSPLPAAWAVDGEPLHPARIYIAPPGQHLIIRDGAIGIGGGPRVNRHRPSVDVLFGSAARWAGSATTAVVLSGALDDGAVGAALVGLVGGRVLVQDPGTAEFDSMPRAALAAVPGALVIDDGVAPGPVVGDAVLASLRESETAPVEIRPVPGADSEVSMAPDVPDQLGFLLPGESELTRLSCPDCGGGLARVDLPTISYFRCHVGHQYGPQSLLAAQADQTEHRLWSAVVALEEQAVLERYIERAGLIPTEAVRPPATEFADRAARLRRHLLQWTRTEGDEPAQV